MSRVRLTQKTAGDEMKSKANAQVEAKGAGVDNDSYDMNDTGHDKNQPKLETYAKGDPESWNEGVNKDNLWKKDKRDEMHVPEITAKMAAEAVASAKKLEEKAIKCIVASQRMLPGAADDLIEAQAADLMHLPENSLNATLSRQEELAQKLANVASEAVDAAKEDDKHEETETKEEEKKEEECKDKDEKKDASADGKGQSSNKKGYAAMLTKLEAMMNDVKEAMSQDDAEDKDAAKVEDDKKDEKEAAKAEDSEEDKEAAKADDKEDDKKDEKDAAKAEDSEEDKEAAKAEDKKDEEESKEAGETSLLDEIFNQVTASDNKKGAKTLSGMVKKEASTQDNDQLASMWRADPDVSGIFR